MLVFHFSDLFKIYQYKYKLNINCLSIQTYAAKDLMKKRNFGWDYFLEWSQEEQYWEGDHIGIKLFLYFFKEYICQI